METNNETVNDIRAEVGEYLTSIGPSEIPSETQVEEFADRFVAAHEREMNALVRRKEEEASEAFVKNAELADAIAAKDAEIAQIKACRNGDCNRLRLGAEPCPGCHIQTNIDKIDSLKSLVKELTDTLQKHLGCSGYCEGCMLTKLKYECETKSDYELVRKAREVLNG